MSNKKVMELPTFSERLKEYRRKNGLTQTQLASMLGVSGNYVGMLEGGRPMDEDSTLAKLFARYEVGEGAPGARGRLKAAREQAGLTQADLAKKIGYQLGVIQAVEDGNARASENMIEKICAVLPGISKPDLMGGSDHPANFGESIGTYGQKPRIDLPPGMTARYVPLISWAQAGTMASFDDTSYQYDAAIAFNVKDPRAIAVQIRGDSMSPQYGEGDVVILYPSYAAKNGDLVIARLVEDKGSDVMFKIYNAMDNGRRVALTSYNPAFPPLDYSREDFAWIYPAASVVKQLKH